jgi:hypothetical protein
LLEPIVKPHEVDRLRSNSRWRRGSVGTRSLRLA